jgi:ubiquinone/menaquinone biosynthesis C-methylase UbiE
MKHTDYGPIAEIYDNNPLRHDIGKDSLIETVYGKSVRPMRLLDLGCGTGNYLAAQLGHYGNCSIEWIGADKSLPMIEKALGKNIPAAFVNCDACHLPFGNGFFDFIKVRFAHHHFTDKKRAFEEIARVIRSGGTLSIFNLAHEHMKHSWLYEYFPEAETEDAKRFPRLLELNAMLKNHFSNIEIRAYTEIRDYTFSEILSEAENRDNSSLVIIPGKAYQNGLTRLRKDSGRKKTFTGEIAFVRCTCVK